PSGEPVFGLDFNSLLHVDGKLIYDPRSLMIGGWDFGRRRPAFVASQTSREGHLIRFRSLLGENEPLSRFRDRMIMMREHEFPGVPGWIDFCDPHGTAKRDTSEKSSIDVLREGGIQPRWKDTEIEYRLDLMSLGLS